MRTVNAAPRRNTYGYSNVASIIALIITVKNIVVAWERIRTNRLYRLLTSMQSSLNSLFEILDRSGIGRIVNACRREVQSTEIFHYMFVIELKKEQCQDRWGEARILIYQIRRERHNRATKMEKFDEISRNPDWTKTNNRRNEQKFRLDEDKGSWKRFDSCLDKPIERGIEVDRFLCFCSSSISWRLVERYDMFDFSTWSDSNEFDLVSSLISERDPSMNMEFFFRKKSLEWKVAEGRERARESENGSIQCRWWSCCWICSLEIKMGGEEALIDN